MTLNLMNDDPEYLITNLLLPARERFFSQTTSDGKKRYRFNSYSFGVVNSKYGPALVDEAIAYIREINTKYHKNPIKWSDLLEKYSTNTLSQLQNRLLD
jgi:hypothetical protein